jgi:signal transduction histidine kinase
MGVNEQVRVSGMRWNRPNARMVLRLVLVALLASTATYGLLSLHAQVREAIHDTHTKAETTALLLEQHAAATIDAVDQLVERVRERLAPDGVRRYGDQDWSELRTLAGSLKPVDVLALFDRDGRLALTSRTLSTPDYSIADRDYFLAHRDQGTALILGPAHQSPTMKDKTFFTVSRSLVDREGRFQGVVVAVIDVGYFRDIYRKLNLGSRAALALLRSDGALLLREPFSQALLESGAPDRIRTWKLFTDYLDHGVASGSYEGESMTDGLTRTFAFRRLEDHPLVALVMLSHEDAVLDMLPGILRSAGLGATVLAFLLALTWWSFRIIDREDQARNDLAETNRRLTKALDDAEAASRAKSIFLSNMSHELRTPLNAILGFAEVMADGYAGPVGPRQQDYLGHIREAGRHLLDILSEVLDLSKVASGTLSLNEDTVEVASVVTATLKLIGDKAQSRKIALLTDLPSDLPALCADSLRCKQVLLSLLSNAVKFTPPGGAVTVSAWSDDSGLSITVGDTGPGMAPGDIADALDAFGALASSPTKTHGGAGIGLPLARKLMELHDGTLSIDSAVGAGTRVTIRFPAERVLWDLTLERQVAG